MSSSNGKGDPGQFPFRFEVVPIKHLVVAEYQRPLTTFVEKITKDFNPALVGTLAVSERSKTKFALIDGQTRAEGMKRLGITAAPCVVYEGLDVHQEARLFALFQTQRRGMHSADRFRAQVIAGEPTQVEINRIAEECGFVIGKNRGTRQGDRPYIPAVAALEYVYRGAQTGGRDTKNPELLVQTLSTIKQAWPAVPETAVSATIIRGVGHWLKRTPNVDEERLVQRLHRHTPSELAKRAEALREGAGMSGKSPKYLADAIDTIYRRR